jgi:integrase
VFARTGGFAKGKDSAMGSMVSGLADAVLGVVKGVGLSSDTVARYGKCCEAVVAFCGRRGFDALSVSVVDEFAARQQERARRGEIGRNRRNALLKTARMMLEFQRTGRVTWQMMRPGSGPSESFREVLEQFTAAAGRDVAPGSVRLLAGEIRHFLTYLDRAGRDALGAVTADDVRGFMVEMAPRRPAGIGNVVWSLKRFFAFLNAAGLSDVRIDGLLAHAAPRRVRALPCFTREETGRFLEGIETGTPCGKRDYAMVVLAVSTGLRCCDIIALRLEEIDWRRDEIRLVQAKTSKPLVLPLPALAGNAVAEWILHGRPDCDAPEVFVRLQPPYVKLGNSAGSTLMRRRLARAGVDHVARDGKSFHALRRTTGTRLIESGAGLPLAAQILGHACINSSRRYFALATEQLRQCCLPLDEFACTREGLR